MLYTYSDALGSLIALTNESGKLIERYAYDPWSQRRNLDQWELKDSRTHWIVNRGYTGHEHLDAFGIINMNGRVYDPLTAMFMSPDPYVQAPGNWLNYNRYGYCMNNPTNFTDPTGYQRMYIDMPAFSEFASHWGEYATSGASDWSHKDRGPIRYDFDDHKYQYANGDEATEQEAMDMYAKPSNSHTYYGQNASTVFRSLRDGDEYTNRALNNIGVSIQESINKTPDALGIMVSLSQEFAKVNSGSFVITTLGGSQVMMTTDQLIGGLEVASFGTAVLGIGVEAGLARFGKGEIQQQAQQNFWSDSMVSISLYTISAAGCGVPALVLGIGWIMYRNGAFDGLNLPTPQYYQNNYHLNSMPQDAIRPQYPLKDGPQPIYFHY